MKNILHIIESLDQKSGGTIRSVIDLVVKIDGNEFTNTILGFGALNIRDNPLGDKSIYSLPIRGPASYRYSTALLPWLRKHIDRYNGVVLHGMWVYPIFATAKECIKRGIPYVCIPHGMLDPWSIYGQDIIKAIKKIIYWNIREKNIYRNARAIYFSTNREKQMANMFLTDCCPQCQIIPCIVSNMICSNNETPRLGLMQPKDRKIVLSLGRIHPKKNTEFLINAFRLAGLKKEWHLIIAGSGPRRYLNYLKKYVKDINLQNNIHFVGFVSGADKKYLFNRSQWFVLPSKQENYGIAVLEAISNGCPVAVSDQVYISESFHHKSEILPLNIQAWTSFMHDRMTNDSWRKQLIDCDKAHFSKIFNMDKIAQSWEEAFNNVF
jgi:glycosyltransferase involved in cell wall biosynthesis